VSPVKYEQGFYIPEDGILRSHRREHLKSYICSTRHRFYEQKLGSVTIVCAVFEPEASGNVPLGASLQNR
jgi:hypothetical protein